MDNSPMPDGQFQENRQSGVCHLLVFASTADGNMVISVSPILRKSYTEAMDSFCDNHKLQIAALPDHVSYHGPPLIGLLQKEIRGHTGIDTFSSGLGLILTASATLDGQMKAGRFRYSAAVFSKFRVSAIHIAIQTARTNFLTAMPRVPRWHRTTPTILQHR